MNPLLLVLVLVVVLGFAGFFEDEDEDEEEDELASGLKLAPMGVGRAKSSHGTARCVKMAQWESRQE